MILKLFQKLLMSDIYILFFREVDSLDSQPVAEAESWNKNFDVACGTD